MSKSSGYLNALGFVSLASVLTFWFKPYITQMPTGFFTLAVLLCALTQGPGPSFLAALLSVAVDSYLFMEPVYSFRVNSTSDLLRLLVLLVLAVTVSSLKESKKRLEKVLESVLLFRGMEPRVSMCSICHNVHGLNGQWHSLEQVVQDSGAPVSDTVCPHCSSGMKASA